MPKRWKANDQSGWSHPELEAIVERVREQLRAALDALAKYDQKEEKDG